jgi:hypothetical protein
MGLQQQQTAARVNDLAFVVPPDIAAAATRYQAFREIEAEHLALMSTFDLSREWSAEIRQIVFNAGDHIRHARDARLHFRAQVRDFVLALRRAREPLSAVLRQTRSMLQLLETSGALRGDGGWLEVEVLEWAIEEYENAA